jgi:hypothetical protein
MEAGRFAALLVASLLSVPHRASYLTNTLSIPIQKALLSLAVVGLGLLLCNISDLIKTVSFLFVIIVTTFIDSHTYTLPSTLQIVLFINFISSIHPIGMSQEKDLLDEQNEEMQEEDLLDEQNGYMQEDADLAYDFSILPILFSDAGEHNTPSEVQPEWAPAKNATEAMAFLLYQFSRIPRDTFRLLWSFLIHPDFNIKDLPTETTLEKFHERLPLLRYYQLPTGDKQPAYACR